MYGHVPPFGGVLCSVAVLRGTAGGACGAVTAHQTPIAAWPRMVKRSKSWHLSLGFMACILGMRPPECFLCIHSSIECTHRPSPPLLPSRGTPRGLPPPPPGPRTRTGCAWHAWPANMQSRQGSHRAPPRRPLSLKIGPQIKSNHIPPRNPPLPIPPLPARVLRPTVSCGVDSVETRGFTPPPSAVMCRPQLK